MPRVGRDGAERVGCLGLAGAICMRSANLRLIFILISISFVFVFLFLFLFLFFFYYYYLYLLFFISVVCLFFIFRLPFILFYFIFDLLIYLFISFHVMFWFLSTPPHTPSLPPPSTIVYIPPPLPPFSSSLWPAFSPLQASRIAVLLFGFLSRHLPSPWFQLGGLPCSSPALRCLSTAH